MRGRAASVCFDEPARGLHEVDLSRLAAALEFSVASTRSSSTNIEKASGTRPTGTWRWVRARVRRGGRGRVRRPTPQVHGQRPQSRCVHRCRWSRTRRRSRSRVRRVHNVSDVDCEIPLGASDVHQRRVRCREVELRPGRARTGSAPVRRRQVPRLHPAPRELALYRRDGLDPRGRGARSGDAAAQPEESRRHLHRRVRRHPEGLRELARCQTGPAVGE